MFYRESVKTLEQVAQGGGGNIQCQTGSGSEQPGLVKDVPARGRGVGLMTFKGPFQPQIFCHSLLSVLFWLSGVTQQRRVRKGVGSFSVLQHWGKTCLIKFKFTVVAVLPAQVGTLCALHLLSCALR